MLQIKIKIKIIIFCFQSLKGEASLYQSIEASESPYTERYDNFSPSKLLKKKLLIVTDKIGGMSSPKSHH
jgi:hypothetical protein